MSDSPKSQVDANEKEDELYQLAQHNVIAAALYKPSSLTTMLEVISADDFADEKYNAIMQAIVNVHRMDIPITFTSVAKELEKEGLLDFIGGISYLYQLHFDGEDVAISNPVSVIAGIVKEYSVKAKIREMFSTNTGIFHHDSGVSASDAIEEVQGFLSEQALSLSDDSSSTTAVEFVETFEDILAQRRKVSEENKEVSGGLQGIPTLLPSLNKYTSGFTPGQLITVGAATGAGKSVFAIMCTISALQAAKSVMFFSLEMSEVEVFDRIYANMAEVKLNKIKTGEVDDEEMARLKETSKFLSTAKLKIDADPKETVDTIRSKAMRQQQSEEGLDMIIIDYLQLVTASSRFNSRQEFIADLSRNIKLLAKTLQIPIMILVQLNRPKNDNGEVERPTLDRIRESAAIAQDSDIVVLLHRDNTVDNKVPQTLILLEKNRSGESNKVIRCHTELAYSDFREVKPKDLTGAEDVDSGFGIEGNENTDSAQDDFAESGVTNPETFYSDDFDIELDFDGNEDDFFDS